jgi:lipooligosaccharide transport system permease protein
MSAIARHAPSRVPGLHVLEFNVAVYRRNWRGSAFSSFLQPVLFLAAMGVGLGSFVSSGGGTVGGVSYLEFLAPGLLAAQAMQAAAGEAAWPILGKVKWDKTYFAMLATPLRVGDLLVGEVAWITVRLAMVCSIFFGVTVAFGAVLSPIGILAIPAGMLTGLAFAAPIIGYSARLDNDAGFNALFRFVITPLFLFSGTFFPIDQLPALLQPIAYLTPLWHGVTLTRNLTLGTIEPALAAVNVAVLLAYVTAGVVFARVSLGRRLVK